MEIVKLPVGERAPLESDCISVDQLPDGSFNLTGSILTADDTSVAIVSPIVCDTQESAEQQGLAWAKECGVPKLFVATTLLA